MNHTTILFAVVLMLAAVSVHAVNFGFPVNFPTFQFPNPGQGGNFQAVSITSGGPTGLDNRFDEHGQSAPAATINTFSSQNGHVTHMTHHIDKDGKVTTQTNKNSNKRN
uniref:Uncharacterized protein n=1 Tax=Anopheles farauti TaxID=69004 RepID=A0A182QJD5_9DIPT